MNLCLDIYTNVQELPNLSYIEYKKESEIVFD